MSLPEILCRKSPPLVSISMNRPEKKNALTPGMMDTMHHELVKAKDDPDIKVIIITGEAGSFSAGADIEDMTDGRVINQHNDDVCRIKDFHTTSRCEGVRRFKSLSFFDIAAIASSPTTTHMK